MASDRQWAAGQGDFFDAGYYLWKLDSVECETDADRIVMALRAQAHATLALTAVTALRGMNDMPGQEFSSWKAFLTENAKPYNH